MCDPLSDSGVVFQGASAGLTEESLVEAIAAQFGFDPATGIDLE